MTTRRNFTTCFTLATLTGLARPTQAAKPEKKPNVLFIVLDDMNNDLTFLDGQPKARTPNLQRLAGRSHLFTRAYCAAPACNPTRAAVFSGVPPHQSGVYGNPDELIRSQPLDTCTYLPEHFRTRGYWTMWAGKTFHKKPSEERLAKLWNNMEHRDGGYGPNVQKGKGEIPFKTWGNCQKWTGPDTDFPDVRNTDGVIAALANPQEQPFFIALGLYRPHVPYTAPKRFFDLYERDQIPLPPILENDVDDLPPAAMKWINDSKGHRKDANKVIKTGTLKTVLHGYLASTSFADWNVGRVLDALDQSDHADNTIVVLWGDHGFHHGEKERFTKFALWEKTTNMPMLFRLPGQTARQVIANPVSQMDLYPTLCDLCGLDTPEHVFGKSLVPMFEDPEKPLGPALTTFEKDNHTLRTRKYRYIHYANGDEEFYVHADDPHEWHNQAGNPEYRNMMDKLKSQLPKSRVEPVGGKKKKQ
ncbi:Choline-sulfatase [Pontiella desulfatans]|uniref:Choline-sulfatase n=1 Tax=Pontiella desulfatans TaxID=2750659 RepID=A0A6C2TZI5_PONDE|nr:sulfatase [Pontiella desulfatans]SPS73733.1 sulfatase S1_7 [Kiritimatiellales bacterium]VGO13082.1 Choline-sulfatase [Pontiella desulfatans]